MGYYTDAQQAALYYSRRRRREGSPASAAALFFPGGQLGAVYDPSDMLSLWQDVDGTVPVRSDGDIVSRMDDVSGNGNYVVTNSATRQPLFKTDGTTRWLYFDGANDYMQIGFALPQPWDRISGVRQLASKNGDNIFYGFSDWRGVLQQRVIAGDIAIYNNAYLQASGTMDADQVIFEHYDGAASIIGIDGTDQTGTTGAADACTGITIGAANTGADPAEFRFYGAIMRSELSSAERVAAEAWIQERMPS